MADAGAPEGNNNYKKGAIFNDALRRAIAQDDGKRIRGAAEKLLDLASEGTPWAVRELADRTDGKAAMSVALSGGLEIIKRAEDLTDDQLANIATSSSGRASKET